MTTRDPGDSEVLTQGLERSPRSAAFLASSPAPTMTWGFDVLAQLVMAAMTAARAVMWWCVGAAGGRGAVCGLGPSATLKASPAGLRAARSCGRDGPASDG